MTTPTPKSPAKQPAKSTAPTKSTAATAPTASFVTPTARKHEVTSPKAASAAATVLRDPAASPAAKTAAASALTQTAPGYAKPDPVLDKVESDLESQRVEMAALRAENERLTSELDAANRRADEQAEWARRQKA